MNKNGINKVAQVALLVAIEVILSRFFSISTPIVKIGFGFLPLAVMGMLYGPVYAMVGGGLADFIGAILFPIGAYFPGFTLTTALAGLVYGLVLYEKPKTIIRISFAVVMISLALHLGLDTLWLQIITGKGYIALFPARILKSIIMVPMQIIAIKFAWEKVCPLATGKLVRN